jgi:hypothetical protein
LQKLTSEIVDSIKEAMAKVIAKGEVKPLMSYFIKKRESEKGIVNGNG